MSGILNGETDEPLYTQQTAWTTYWATDPSYNRASQMLWHNTVLILYMVTNYGAYEQYRYLNKYMHLLSAPAVMIILITGNQRCSAVCFSSEHPGNSGFSPPERVNYWGETQVSSPLTSASTAPEPAALFRHSRHSRANSFVEVLKLLLAVSSLYPFLFFCDCFYSLSVLNIRTEISLE